MIQVIQDSLLITIPSVAMEKNAQVDGIFIFPGHKSEYEPVCTMKSNDMPRAALDLWIGLAEVEPTGENDDLDKPAFVNVLGLASDEDSFFGIVQVECREIGAKLVDLTEVELWRHRQTNSDSDAEIVALAKSISRHSPFGFHTFMTFDPE